MTNEAVRAEPEEKARSWVKSRPILFNKVD